MTLLCAGIESLLFTSDTPTLTGDWGNIDNELMTANFKWNSEEELAKIKVGLYHRVNICTEFAARSSFFTCYQVCDIDL